jgi:hypothetical protein
LISANKTVTVLRSPSSASGELLSGATRTLEAKLGDDEVTAAAPAPFVSGAPHLPQKSDVAGFSALHFAQCFASAVPHFAQKLLAGGLLVPHFEQRIDAPRANQTIDRSYITQRWLPTSSYGRHDRNTCHCRTKPQLTILGRGWSDAQDGPPAVRSVQLQVGGNSLAQYHPLPAIRLFACGGGSAQQGPPSTRRTPEPGNARSRPGALAALCVVMSGLSLMPFLGPCCCPSARVGASEPLVPSLS